VIVDPQSTEPGSVYKLMIGAIVPRPIALVATVSGDGARNLAAFSFFTGVSANPPVVCFSPMVRGGNSAEPQKDTLRNIVATREFVVNIVSEDFSEKMNQTAPEFPPEVDEFAVSGLTPVASDLVRPPRVGESLISMECKLLEVVSVSAKPLGGAAISCEGCDRGELPYRSGPAAPHWTHGRQQLRADNRPVRDGASEGLKVLSRCVA
jgi:flavin reductase (DIM6/NTAB) family NADH-FMN oxidoreductase RutF